MSHAYNYALKSTVTLETLNVLTLETLNVKYEIFN